MMHENFGRSGWFLSGHQWSVWIVPVVIFVVLFAITFFVFKRKSEKK